MDSGTKTFNVIHGDIFSSDADIIVHQVNCQGVMGSGVAKQVKDLFPRTFESYLESVHNEIDSKMLLGRVLMTRERLKGREIRIANLFAQNYFGYGKRYTDYVALQMCLINMCDLIDTDYNMSYDQKANRPRIAIPYMMSCDRGGGSWDVVSTIICRELAGKSFDFYKLGKD